MTASALLVYFLSFLGVDVEALDLAPPEPGYSTSREEDTSATDVRDRVYDGTHRRISNGF
jgi:hypothetical protein